MRCYITLGHWFLKKNISSVNRKRTEDAQLPRFLLTGTGSESKLVLELVLCWFSQQLHL